MFLEFYTGVSPFADRFGSGDMAAEKEKRRTFVFRGGAAYPGANISRKVDNVLKGCLEYLEDMRFQSAQEVLAALETDDLKSGVCALKARDFGEAERVARALTEQPNQAEERRIQAHMLLSKEKAVNRRRRPWNSSRGSFLRDWRRTPRRRSRWPF